MYTTHCSAPMADLSAVYKGSRSIRAGIIWLDLATLSTPGVDVERDFVDRIGVERLMDGRLKAAGSMSGIVILE